jgi:hypothetical protein
MDQLINDIFGDDSITLNCDSGECMHYTQVPGYEVGRQACLSITSRMKRFKKFVVSTGS